MSIVVEMETEGGLGNKVKRTCDSCAASKVKCSGTLPCERCSSRHLDCFYRARKKRALKTSEEDVKRSRDVPKAAGLQAPSQIETVKDEKLMTDLAHRSTLLLPHEKRAWVVFFSIYKNYNAPCARFWFERQLARIKMRLERSNQFEMAAMLRDWAARLDIDYNKVQDRAEMCVRAMASPNAKGLALHNCGGLHLHVDGKVVQGSGNSERIFSAKDKSRVRMEDMFCAPPTTPQLRLSFSGTFPEDVAIAVVNPAFEELFGLTQMDINAKMQLTGSGLLPWGGDILSLLCPLEADIFAYMQVCAINLSWHFLARDRSEFPLIREMPSAHVVPLLTPHEPRPIPCVIKCVHRDHVDLEKGLSTEILMIFEPLKPMSFVTPAGGAYPVQLSHDLPLADETDYSASPSDGSSSRAGESPPEDQEDGIFFPDVGPVDGDEDFLLSLLNFARDEDLS